ncbi:MAG: YicC/YloC family endoribonuclease [Methylococcaceae bacterium]
MIRSMTAFANCSAEIAGMPYNCELRSVNHRYCDISLKLPERLRFIEAELRTQIAEQLKRGKIECTVSYAKQLKNSPQIVINTSAVAALLTATQQIEQQMHAAARFSALEVLAFPGIQLEPDVDKDELASGISGLLNNTLKQFLEAREREGSQLKALLETRCHKMQHYVEEASLRLPQVLLQIRNKLTSRIQELAVEPSFDRLEQELVFLAQKLDVAEELDRLQSHIHEVINTLNQNDAVGRRLDFLMQELNREANTLGSKSADKDMTQIAIELKVLIEQMREQVQNIE